MSEKLIKDVDIQQGSHGRDIVNLMDALFEKARTDRSGGEARQETFDRMDRNQRYYDGKHWQRKMPKYRAMSVTNKPYAIVEGAVPIITDNRPKAEIVPGHPEDVEIVKELRDVYEAKYDDLDLQMKTELVVKEHLIKTEGYWKIFWNPLLMGGLGDVDVRVISPKNMYFIGGTDPLLKDCYAAIYYARHSVGELRATYPKKADAIKREWAAESKSAPAMEEVADTYGKHDQVSDDGSGSVVTYHSAKSEAMSGTEQMYLMEMWLDDKTVFHYDPEMAVAVNEAGEFEVVGDLKLNPELQQQLLSQGVDFESIRASEIEKATGGELENQDKWLRRYPHGRILAKVGNLLLEDKPSVYRHGRCPYVRFFGCPVPGKNYFYGEVDQIIPLVDEINKLNSQVVDILSLTQNPPMLVNIMSGIKPGKMTNQPGLIIPTQMDVDRAAKWLQVPNFPNAIFVHINNRADDVDGVSGYHDITQGRKPTGITAGVAIESLQEAAQTRYRQKARYLEYSLRLAAELIISVIWQFYIEDRIVRMKNKENPSEYIFKTVNFRNRELAGGLPDVRIKSGSTMPVNEAVRRQQGIQLFEVGGIDQLELLEVFDWPNAEEIVTRMEKKMQEMAQMQMQQGGMQGAG